MSKGMSKIFLSIVGVAIVGFIFSGDVLAKNPHKLTNEEIEELINNINNELNVKDIPALQDKVVVVDQNWNVVLEKPVAEVVESKGPSAEKKLIKKSELLMVYAGNSYYLLD